MVNISENKTQSRSPQNTKSKVQSFYLLFNPNPRGMVECLLRSCGVGSQRDILGL